MLMVPAFLIGPVEVIFIAVVVMLLFGTSKLPTIAENMGKGLNQLRDAAGGLLEDVEEPLAEENPEGDKQASAGDEPPNDAP